MTYPGCSLCSLHWQRQQRRPRQEPRCALWTPAAAARAAPRSGAARREAVAPGRQEAADAEAFEPPELHGMLYYDGVDSLGRPVVVVNADAVAAKVGAPDRVGSGQVGRPVMVVNRGRHGRQGGAQHACAPLPRFTGPSRRIHGRRRPGAWASALGCTLACCAALTPLRLARAGPAACGARPRAVRCMWPQSGWGIYLQGPMPRAPTCT